MENENYSKSQIISGILTAIKNKNKSDFNIFDENAYGKKFRDLQSKIPENDTGNTQNQNNLDNILSSLDKEDIDKLFHKAGILAFLYNVTEIGNYNFASNLNDTTFGGDGDSRGETIKKLSRADLEKKAIQYDVALLSAYQDEVDKIMRSEIKDPNAKYTVDDLKAEDYEFIKLSVDDKKEVLKSLDEDKYSKILKSYPSFSENKLKDIKTISIWNSLLNEEEAINEYLEEGRKIKDQYNDEKRNLNENNSALESLEKEYKIKLVNIYNEFKKKVISKYISSKNFGPKNTINKFLLKFSKVWKNKDYTKKIFDIKIPDINFGIRKKADDYCRGSKGGYHEHLLASFYIDYLTNQKWEQEKAIITILIRQLVQKTDMVIATYGQSEEVTHKIACGGKLTDEQKENLDFMRCVNYIKNDFHDNLRKAINDSHSIGEILNNIKTTVIYRQDSLLTADSKKNFYENFCKAIKGVNVKK